MLVDVGDTRLHVTERGAGDLALFVLHGGPGPRPHDVRLLPRRARRSLPAAARRRARHRALGARAAGDLGARASRRRRRGDGRRARARALRGPRALLRGVHRAAARGRLPGRPGRDDRLQRHPRRALPRARRGASSPPSSPSSCASRCRRRGRARPTRARRRTSPRCSPTSCPFHFADPRDPRIDDLRAAMADAVYGPDVLRAAATEDYGAIAVEDRLAEVTPPGARARRAPRPHLPGAGRRGDGGRACPTPSSSSSSTAATWPSSRRTRPTSTRCATSSSAAPRRLSAQPPARTSAAAASAGVELVAHELEALRPERRVLEVEPGDGGQLLGAARAARAEQLEVARHEVLALLEVAAVDAERQQLAVGVGVDVARRADEVRHVGPPQPVAVGDLHRVAEHLGLRLRATARRSARR